MSHDHSIEQEIWYQVEYSNKVMNAAQRFWVSRQPMSFATLHIRLLWLVSLKMLDDMDVLYIFINTKMELVMVSRYSLYHTEALLKDLSRSNIRNLVKKLDKIGLTDSGQTDIPKYKYKYR